MTSKCKKSQIWPFRPWKMTFRAIQPNLSFDMWFMSPKRSFMPKKKKSYWSVSEIDPSPPPQSWRTDRQTDGWTDRQTDRRTTDKSVLEKLRCLSAGGAKKLTKSEIRSSSSRFEHCSESLIWSIGSHIWSLFAPIHMKSWPKVKLGQVQVGSNIAQNHSFSPQEVISGHY